jgi:hypothetical protein
MKPDMKPRKAFKGCLGHLGCALFCIPGSQQVFHVGAHEIGQQRLLVGKVIVQRSRLHPDFTRNLAHGNGSKPARSKQLERRLAHPLGRFNANTACRSSHAITGIIK